MVGRPIDVHVAPTDGAILSEITAAAGGNCTVMIPDIQTLIDTENNPSLSTGARGRRQADDPWTWGYHEYDEVCAPPPWHCRRMCETCCKGTYRCMRFWICLRPADPLGNLHHPRDLVLTRTVTAPSSSTVPPDHSPLSRGRGAQARWSGVELQHRQVVRGPRADCGSHHRW